MDPRARLQYAKQVHFRQAVSGGTMSPGLWVTQEDSVMGGIPELQTETRGLGEAPSYIAPPSVFSEPRGVEEEFGLITHCKHCSVNTTIFHFSKNCLVWHMVIELL